MQAGGVIPMERRYTILIIDDSKLNRENLKDILSSEYEILEAEDGKKGLKVLEKKLKRIDLIILDLVMPVMDGYEFMENVTKNPRFKSIPIIIATTENYLEHEKRCLEYGVWDFIPKSCHNEIIKARVNNAIERSFFHTLERNELTGLYNHLKFFHETEYLLAQNPKEKYAFVHMDIERFKNINDFYGIEGADLVIKHMANVIFNTLKPYADSLTYGHIIADEFCICMPRKNGKYQEVLKKIVSETKKYKIDFQLEIAVGIYEFEDNKEAISSIYDKAISAAKSIKGDYSIHYGFYTSEMASRALWEKTIVERMDEAIKKGEFKVYYQPKFNSKTGELVSAEALVRWIMTDGTVVSPMDFIPIFERNGFIIKLDFYIWDKVCKFLHKEQERGYEIKPVSVNVSRVDIYDPKFYDKVVNLVKKYDLDPSYFKLEITESVFAIDYDYISTTIDKLHKAGFTVLMDDFGSGYSSFNMLKDIDVDIIKLDMKFLSLNCSYKEEKILECIVDMAEAIDIEIIAEGVETDEQVRMLNRLGCYLVQGYRYGRPMPENKYKSILRGNK